MSLDNPCGAGSARHTRSCSSPLVLSLRRVQRGHGHREARVVSCFWAVGSLPSIREGFRISSPRPERLLAALCSRSPTRLSCGTPCWLGQQCTPGWQRWYTLLRGHKEQGTMNLLVYPLSEFLSITLPAHHREHSDSQYPRLPPTTKAPKAQQSHSAVTCEHFQTPAWPHLQPHSTCCAGSTQPAPRRRR